MRKTMICAFTAAAALAVTTAQPMTALAANWTYGTAGNSQSKIMIGEARGLNVQELLGNLNLDCDSQGNWRPEISLPGINRPGTQCPELPVRPGQSNPSQLPGQPNCPSRPELPGQSHKPEKPDRPEVPEKPDRPEVPEQPGNGGSIGDQNGDSHDAWTRQVVELVNAERAKAGLPALTVDSGAASAAQVRAKEIASAFSHTRPDGSSFSTALKEAGVSYSSAGENIAYGQQSPQEVMKQWMNSAGHRANILNPDYTAIGVGHHETGAGVDYWTQLFIR